MKKYALKTHSVYCFGNKYVEIFIFRKLKWYCDISDMYKIHRLLLVIFPLVFFFFSLAVLLSITAKNRLILRDKASILKFRLHP